MPEESRSLVEKGGNGRKPASAIAALSAENSAAAVAWLQAANSEECAALIGRQSLADLPPLLREAVLLRLSEVDPERLATLLLDPRTRRSPSDRWQRWLSWLALTHPDLVKARLDDPSLGKEQRDLLERTLRQAAIAGHNDPSRTLEDALAGADFNRIAGALSALAERDPKQAIRELSKLLESGAWFRPSDGSLFAKLAAEDPEGMKAAFALVKTPELQLSMASAIARAIAKDDPSQAVAFFDSLPPSRVRSFTAIEIASAWSKKDPEAALAWVQSALPEGPAKRSALAVALAPLIDTDPARVLSAISVGERYSDKLSSMTTGQGSMGLNVPGILSANSIRERAALALLEKDPLQAVTLLQEQEAIPKGGKPGSQFSRATLLGKVTGIWMKDDPSAAVAWLSGLEKQERNNLLNQQELAFPFHSLAASEISKSAMLVAGMEDKQFAERLLSQLAPAMAGADPAAAIQFAKQLPEESRGSFLQRTIAEVAKADPKVAASEIANLPQKLRPSAHGSIAEAISATNAGDAVRYLDGVPREECEMSQYRTTLSRWGGENWAQAKEWWYNLPAEDNMRQEAALTSLAGRLYESDPSTGAQIVGRIGELPDINVRYQAFSSFIHSIAREHPDEAQALVDEPGMELPKHASQSLKSYIDMMKRMNRQ